MNRTEFLAITAVVLLIAFALGWVACWVVARLGRVTQENMTDLDTMAQQLHDAEEQRNQAIAYLHHREAELEGKIVQTEAELRAAMDGLGEARAEAGNLRRYIERMNA